VMEMAPPGHQVRIDFTVQGMTGTQAYDGRSGWQVMPFMGQTEPQAMAAEDVKDIRENADFAGPLFDYKEKGNKVEYLGKADLSGTTVQKLKLTEKDGAVTIIYLDGDSYLERKEETSRSVRGQQVDLETLYGAYKQVNGLTLPYTLEIKAKGKPDAQTITLDKIEVNPDLPAGRFDMPKVDKKPEAPKPDAAKPEAAPPKRSAGQTKMGETWRSPPFGSRPCLIPATCGLAGGKGLEAGPA
jgi:hypothetical protein